MDLRKYLCLGALVAGLAAAPAAADTITLKLSHFVPTTIGLSTEFMIPWTERITRCTGGAVAFEVHPAGSALGHIDKQYDQARAGVVDVAFGHIAFPRGRFPRSSIIELPFMAQSANAGSFALYGVAEAYLRPEYQGVKILGMMTHNPGGIHTNRRITDLAEMKGLRIRTQNAATSAILSHFGADPVNLPPGEQYEALQKGTLDGSATDWTNLREYKLHEVIRHHLEAPVFVGGFFFVMNQKSYDNLPEAARACIDQNAGAALVATFGPLWASWQADSRAIAMQRDPDAILTATPEQIAAWRDALEPVAQTLLAEVKARGVENADEIRAAMQALAAAHP